jgi:glucokinase
VILAGDVGGTKTYLARFEIQGGLPGAPIGTEIFSSANHPSFEALLREYLKMHPGQVDRACFGAAGAVVDRCVRVTTLPWTIDADPLARKLGFGRVDLINDLVATGYGVAALGPDELEPLQTCEAADDANAGLVAAGTGLGESILVRVGKDFLPVATEGGHADFAPRTDEELEVFRAFRTRYGRVSCERIISGRGIVALGEFFHEERGASAEWKRHLAEADAEGPAAVVSRLAISGACDACTDALRLFVGAYGAEAGNMALRAMARAGIYLGGGIAPKILPALKWKEFLEAFRDKDHLRPLLEKIPIWVIRNERTALLGAARYAAIAEG